MNGSVFDLVAPPISQHVISGCVEADAPVNLRGNIVDVALLDPVPRICIKVVIISDTCFGIRSAWVVFCVSPYTEWTDAEFDIWFFSFDCLIDLADKLVYIISSPVINIGKRVFPVLFILYGIRKFLSGYL